MAKHPGGRPPEAQKKIKKNQLLKLLELYPNEQEVCDWFDVSKMSLERFIRAHFDCSFGELREKGFAKTRTAIKRKQISTALSGNTVMLIWVGKQYLGQSEKVENKTDLTTLGKELSPKLVITLPKNGFEGT